MANDNKLIKSSKTGVYYKILQDKDKAFFFTYKDKNDNNKKKWVKVGNYSDGIREINAFNLRAEQLSKMKHGEDITVIANKKKTEILTFNEIAQTYFKDKNSTKNRKSRFKIHLEPTIGNKDILNIKKSTVEKLLNKIEEQGLSNQTINSVQELLSTIYNHYIREYDQKIINPCIGLKKRKIDNNRERYLSLEEINLLKEHIKDNFLISLFVDLSLRTGGRFETILHIQKKDINLTDGTVTLKNLKTSNTYSGYLQKEFLESIRAYIQELSINDYLVSYENKHSEKLTQRQIQHRIKPLIDKLFNDGLDTKDSKNRAVIHTFRHTFASHLAINGVPIYTIMKLMNHAKIDQTLRYAKLSPENGMNAVEDLYK